MFAQLAFIHGCDLMTKDNKLGILIITFVIISTSFSMC